jgi:tetratricopeptide (TPR) repeat protein
VASRWQEIAAAYERDAKAAGQAKRAGPLWFEAGRIYEDRLLQPRQAAASFQMAFKADATFVPVIHAARRFFQDINNWAMVVNLTDSELAVEKDPRRRSVLLTERGRILETKLNKPEEALAAFRGALEADPGADPPLAACTRLLRMRGAWPEVADALRKAAEAAPPGATRVERLLELARVQEGPLQAVPQALETYQQVVAVDGRHPVALRALERLYARTGRSAELLALLDQRRLAAADRQEAASLALSVARLARHALGDEVRALAVLEATRRTCPSDMAILRALAEAYAAAQRHREHVDVLLAMAAEAADDKQRAALKYEAGEILEEQLKDDVAAVAQYASVVAVNPRHLPALQSLGRLYQRTGRLEELAKMYQAEIAVLDDPAQKVPRLFKLAELRAGTLKDEEGAVACYRQVLHLAPGYVPALKALAALLLASRRFEDLVQLHEEELVHTTDRDQRIHLLDRVASLWDDSLGQPAKAAEAYQRILELAPNYLPAIRALARVLSRAERWAELVAVNAMEADLVEDQQQVVALLHENGEILEQRLGNKEAAVQTYKKALALSPNYLPTLKALGRHYGAEGNWPELIAMYRQEAEVTRQVDHRVGLLFKVAELWEVKLKDPARALAAHREVLRERPDHHPSVRALGRLAVQLGDVAAVVETAQLEAKILTDPVEQAHALFAAGESLASKLGRPQEATALFQQALSVHPRFDAALTALLELAGASGDPRLEAEALRRALQARPSGSGWAEAARALAETLAERLNEVEAAAQLYEQVLHQVGDDVLSLRGLLRLATRRRDWARAVAVAEQLALLEPEPHAVAALHLEAAAWKQSHLDPPQDATPNYLKALEYEPGNEVALRALERAYRRTQSWEGLYALYERERGLASDPATVLDLCVRMADLASEHLGKDEQAVADLEVAFRAEPTYLPATRRLEPLYDKLGRHTDKLELMAAGGDVGMDPQKALATLLEVAREQEEKHNNLDKAAECCLRVLEKDPRNAAAMDRLASVWTRGEKWDRLADLLARRGSWSQDPRERVSLLSRAAELLHDKLGRQEEALQLAAGVLAVDPANVPALRMMADTHYDAGRLPEAAQVYAALLPLLQDPALVASVNVRLAELLAGPLQDPAAAMRHYAAAYTADPSDLKVAEKLTELYLGQGMWAEAADALSMLGEKHPDVEARCNHLITLGQVMEEGFRDVPRAVQAYARVLELSPGHSAAASLLGQSYERMGDWAGLAGVYTSILQTILPADKVRRLQLHQALAQLYLKRLNNPDKAIIELKFCLDLEPDNMEVRALRASLWSRNPGNHNLAIPEYLKVLKAQPWRVESLKELRKVYEGQRARDKEYLVCELLSVLRQADRAEQFVFDDNKKKARMESDSTLSLQDHDGLLVHPRERGPVRDVIRLLAPELHKVFVGDLAARGVGKADKVPAKSTDTLRRLCDGMMKNLGGAAFDIYLNKSRPQELVYLSADPAALVVGSEVVRRHTSAELRFVLAEKLEGIFSGHQILEGLTPAMLEEFIQAACLAVDEKFPLLNPRNEVVELSKRVQKAMSRGVRKTLAEPVAALAEVNAKFDAAGHLKALRWTRMRAAHTLTNDLDTAFKIVGRQYGAPVNPADRNDLPGKLGRDEYRELMGFFFSDDHATARQRLRFAVDT